MPEHGADEAPWLNCGVYWRPASSRHPFHAVQPAYLSPEEVAGVEDRLWESSFGSLLMPVSFGRRNDLGDRLDRCVPRTAR